jgi:hypothetical protein
MKFLTITLLFTLWVSQITFAQDYRFGKVSKEEISQKSHPADPAANAAILYRELRTNFEYSQEDGWYTMTEVFERIKIYNNEGFDWATKKVQLYQGSGSRKEIISGLKGYTYNLTSDGKIDEVKLRNDGIFDEKASKYLEVTKFTMPSITEGSVIEYRYRIKSPFVQNIDAYRFQETIPVDHAYLRFAAPEYLNYKTHQKGWLPFKINKNGIDRTMSYKYTESAGTSGNVVDRTRTSDVTFREDISEVTISNAPALKEEKYVGNIDNYATSLKFELSYTKFPGDSYNTYTATWEDVSKTVFESSSFGDELTRTNYFEEDIDNLLQGVSNESEKMMRIFEFVKTKMTWNSVNGMFSEEGVKSAYKKGEGNVGDINLMLAAMLRYAGLNANPVLVSTKSHGIPIYPTINGFNYVIASVIEGGSIIHLLDATNKLNEINILESKLLNWQGRIIAADGNSTWVPLSPKDHAVANTMINASFTDDLSIKGTSKNRFTGHYSMEYRTNYINSSSDDVRKKIEKDMGETEVVEVQFDNLDKLYEPVELSYNFESFDVVENISDKLYFSPMLFMATKENPFKLEQRMYPIDYGYPAKNRLLIAIEVPEGYTVESLPENVQFGLEDNMASFRYSASNTADKIQLSVEFAINEPFLSADSYSGIKQFYELMIAKENEKIVLTKI